MATVRTDGGGDPRARPRRSLRDLRSCSMGIMLLVALAWASTGEAAAQEVRGTIRLESTGEPVSGAVVRLVNDAGVTVNQTLSHETGAYRLLAGAPGRYALAVERIGLATVDVEPFEIGTDEPVVKHLTLGYQPLSLEGISVRGERRCRLQRDASGTVQRLWEEARKTLTSVSLLEDAWLVSFQVTRWERDLDPEYGFVKSERTWRRTVMQASPFETRSPEALVAGGFVREEGDSLVYDGLDARILLSDAFLDAYCFTAVERRDSVGLAFEPLDRSHTIKQIEGTLWLDRETAALGRIEFEYRKVPSPSRRLRSGGTIRFEQLENGAWIVSYWTLRIPRYAIVNGLPSRDIALMHESGGEVQRASVGLGRQPLARVRGTLTGRLLDDDGDPVADALVYLSGTTRADTTGKDGVFRVPDVASGRYGLAWLAPGDRAGERVRVADIEMPPRDTTVEARVAAASYVDDVCPRSGRTGGTGVILGVARGANGVPVAHAPVRITDGAGRYTTMATDRAGRFHVCDARSGTQVEVDTGDGVVAQHVVLRSGRVARIALNADAPDEDGGIVVAEGVVEEPAIDPDAGPARVVGTVISDVDRSPVAAAEVRLGDSIRVLTDTRGRFFVREVPPARLGVTVIHAGYDTLEDTVRVAGGELLQLELRLGPATVDPIVVTARRQGALADVYWRMERAVTGLFIRPDEVRAVAPTRTTDVLQMQPGVHIVSQGLSGGQLELRLGCAPSVYVDGHLMNRAQNRWSDSALGEAYSAVNFVHPSSVEVIEIYRGASEVPGQFSGSTGMCGAIVIWTRRGLHPSGESVRDPSS